MLRWLPVLLLLAFVTAACGSTVESEPAADSGAAAPEAEDAGEASPDDPEEADEAEPAGDAPLTDPPADDEYERAQVTLRGPGEESVDVPVYVADDQELRQQGLMHREELAPGAGMVFLFPDDSEGGFWMKNTLIPLSIAFFAADGDVLAVLDMEPCEEDPCPSYDPGVSYRGTLEVNEGFFDEVGLDEEWRIELPADVEAVQ